VQGGGACPAVAKRMRGRTFCHLCPTKPWRRRARYTKFFGGFWRNRGMNSYKSVLRAGAKVEERSDEIPLWRGKNRDNLSRAAGNNLPILSMLGIGLLIIVLKYDLNQIVPPWNIKKWHIIMPTKQKREKNVNCWSQ